MTEDPRQECIHSGRLSDYLDGHLPPKQRGEIEKHLGSASSCRCRRELDELRSLVDTLRDFPPGAPPADGWEKLEASLDRAPASRRTLSSSWVALAAGVFLGALLLAWAMSQRGGNAAVPQGSRAPTRASAARLHDPDIESQVVSAMRQEELPRIVFRDDRLAAAGAELKSLDSLIELARGLPADPDNREFHDNLLRLQSLREDLLTEMILQAQADRTATWQ